MQTLALCEVSYDSRGMQAGWQYVCPLIPNQRNLQQIRRISAGGAMLSEDDGCAHTVFFEALALERWPVLKDQFSDKHIMDRFHPLE